MHKLFIFITGAISIAICGLLTSCDSDKEEFENDFIEEESTIQFEGVSIIDGFLIFNSKDCFDNFFSSLGSTETTRSSNNCSGIRIPGFYSIADMVSSIRKETKTDISSDDEEEGSLEEYHICQCQELIPDDRFEMFMDTTLQVAIADTLYKITKFGTIVTTLANADLIDGLVSKLSLEELTAINDKTYLISEDIFLYDTFGLFETCNYDENLSLLDDKSNMTTRAGTSSQSQLLSTEDGNTNKYCLSSYTWKNKGVGNIKSLFGLFGTDRVETKTFDSSHRVKCELYDLDYKFANVTGFKISMQKRKKILGIKYWTSTSADDMAIGIEYLHGKIKMNIDINSPLNYYDAGHFFYNYCDKVNNMIYIGCGRFSFINDWLYNCESVRVLYAGISDYKILDKWKINPWDYTTSLTKDAVIGGLEYVEEQMFQLKNVSDKIRLSPMLAITFNGKGTIDTYLRGIQSYGKRENKTITMCSSGGITVGYNGSFSVKPFVEESMSIKGVSIFGAAKYGSGWKGIRFKLDE